VELKLKDLVPLAELEYVSSLIGAFPGLEAHEGLLKECADIWRLVDGKKHDLTLAGLTDGKVKDVPFVSTQRSTCVDDRFTFEGASVVTLCRKKLQELHAFAAINEDVFVWGTSGGGKSHLMNAFAFLKFAEHVLDPDAPRVLWFPDLGEFAKDMVGSFFKSLFLAFFDAQCSSGTDSDRNRSERAAVFRHQVQVGSHWRQPQRPPPSITKKHCERRPPYRSHTAPRGLVHQQQAQVSVLVEMVAMELWIAHEYEEGQRSWKDILEALLPARSTSPSVKGFVDENITLTILSHVAMPITARRPPQTARRRKQEELKILIDVGKTIPFSGQWRASMDGSRPELVAATLSTDVENEFAVQKCIQLQPSLWNYASVDEVLLCPVIEDSEVTKAELGTQVTHEKPSTKAKAAKTAKFFSTSH
jgi:hypothetical protein